MQTACRARAVLSTTLRARACHARDEAARVGLVSSRDRGASALTRRPPVADHGAVATRRISVVRFAAVLALAVGCSSPAAHIAGDTALHGGGRAPAPARSSGAPAIAPGRLGRTPIGELRAEALELAVLPVAGARSALLVSQFAGDRAAWARRIDGATGALGPLLRFAGEHVLGALDWADGRATIVTSDEARVCVATFAKAGDDRPAERGCAVLSPSAVVQVGERLALIELVVQRPPDATASKAARPKGGGAGAAKSAGAGKGAGAAKGRGKRAKEAGKGGKGGGAKKGAHAGGGGARRPSRPIVDVSVRWATRAGVFDAEAKPTGLRFEAPLDGMTLADARARGAGIDLLWFESAPKRKSRSALGSGRLMAAALRADGSLDRGSVVAVFDADLEYGALKDHRAPRLAGDDRTSAVIDLDAKGHCEAMRVLPAIGRLAPQPAICAIAPDRIAGGALAGMELAALERILGEEPRRVAGQPKGDPGLVAWAGDRAYYLRAQAARGGGLRSAGAADGTARDEPIAFPSRRARIAWGAFAPSGEGIALAGGGLAAVDAEGRVERLAEPTAAALRPGVLEAADAPGAERRRVARIGASTWLARGDVVRVAPEPASPAALRGVAQPDTTALVGGRDHGLLIDVNGGQLRVTSVDAAGVSARIGAASASPVRVGFDACERGGGGAIVAGPSSAVAAEVVAFTVDASGTASLARRVPLPIAAGELGVRLTALPSGGALLTDAGRRRVVWLDDDARPVADAAWPADASDALCVDGRPLRLAFPSPVPGRMITLPDPGPGACIVGDAAWARDGSLRWFGSFASGLDAIAEVAVLPLLPPLPAPARPPPAAQGGAPILVSAAPGAPGAPAASPACPGDMVSIAGRFCVDRFEAMIVDAATFEALSPDYPTTPNLLDFAIGEWATGRERIGDVHARALPLPWIAAARIGRKIEPLAIARSFARPSGYTTGLVAEAACAAAGKRLCSLDEFVTACRGEDDTLFPYGDAYQDGVCNVFREEHPAALLHGNASLGHLDPRLNRVSSKGRPLLQHTGQSPACRSRWGSDAVYDMVGNLDEWIDEGSGAFAGGFYSRSTRSGCEALVTAHPRSYLDYSTGVRCCKDAAR